MTRKRKRIREDQARDLSIYGASVGGGAGGISPIIARAGYEDDLYGGKEYGYGLGATAVDAGSDGGSAPSLPSLHQAGPYVHRPEPSYQSGVDYSYAAAGAGMGAAAAIGAYGYEDVEGHGNHPNNSRRVSDQSAGSGGSLSRAVAGAGAGAASNPTLLSFPVPPTTSDALKQQYDLANRMSVASQDSLTDSFGAADNAPVSTRAGAAVSLGAGAAAAAVNHLMMLKQTFDDEEAAAAATRYDQEEVQDVGDSQSLYYLDTGSPSQAYLSAREISAESEAEGVAGSMAASSEQGTQLAVTPNLDHNSAIGYSNLGGATGSQPTTASGGYHADAFTRSSAYETGSGSDVFASAADSSPAMSYSNVSSMGSPGTQILSVPNVTHIRDLIRNVLNDDD